MVTKFYVDKNGNYLGGFAGVEPPKDSIEVPSAPDNASDKWVNGVWVSDESQWRSTATCESAKLKYVLEDSYAILDDIEAVIAQQDGKVRSMWIFTNWSRNNQTLIGMVTQMSQAIPDVKAVVDGAGGVDAFMDAWFKAGIDLIV